jgi:deoxycytidylate deaminase
LIDENGNYTMALPCQRCQRKIINSQIEEVVILRDDGTPLRLDVREYVKDDTLWYETLMEKAVKGDTTNL